MAERTVSLRGVAGAGRRPRAAAGVGWLGQVRALEERPRVVGPHARLGVVWFAVAMVALLAGRWPFAVVLSACAGLAAVQAARTWRRHPRPSAPVAGGTAALLVLAAAAGPLPVAVVAVLAAALVVAGALLGGTNHAAPFLTLVIALVVAGAAVPPVLLLHDGLVPAFVLVVFASVHDASNYVVGSGARSAWEGPAAGAASIAAVTLAVAAVLVPPFRGASPWILGALAAVLAPLGPYAGSALLGERRRARVPALRRLDSLLVLGPVWAAAAWRLL